MVLRQPKWCLFLMLGVVALSMASAQASPVATLYTGGDPLEGLDLQGTFAYALNFRNTTTADLVVDGATFKAVTASSAPAGVTVIDYGLSAFDSITPFEFGATANDNNLEAIAAATVEVSGTISTQVKLNLAVTAGATYKLQILSLGNAGAPRPASYTINGVTTFITLATTAPSSPINSSYVITETFVPATSTTQIIMIHDAGGGNDSFAQGLTLELLPEPASLTLLGLGGLAILGRRRRA
jgi:hypothetical protein